MIKKFLYSSILLAIFSLQNIAYAVTWVKFSQSDEYIFEIDRDSITSQAGVTQVWVKFTIYNDLSRDGLTVGDYMLYLDYIKCKDNKLRTDKGMTYAKDGIIINSFINDSSEYDDVVANTIGEDIFNAVCKGEYAIDQSNDKAIEETKERDDTP